jgi:hypothetical protein
MGQTVQVAADARRILVSVGWGRENLFTDEFEAGTVARQRMQQARLAAAGDNGH